jgi:FG-GAP-like repeat
MKRNAIVPLLMILLTGGGVFSQAQRDVVRHAGFAEFSKGTPGNSGANLYVSRAGRVQVINKWDLNKDGYVDVLISNDHDVFEIVDAFIYWGTGRGVTSLLPELWRERPLAQVLFGVMDHNAAVTRLPAFGGGRSIVADLNRDGHPEIVFCNYIHNYPGLRTAYVYWGSPEGYKSSRRTELPTNWASGVAAADLNGDGYPELVFANQGVESGSEDISVVRGYESYIYHGSATGFDPARPKLLRTRGAIDVAVGDLNKDGHLDLAFLNNSRQAQEVQVFWGAREGYSDSRTQTVAIDEPTSIRADDVDADGYCDLVVTGAGRSETIGFEALKRGKKETAHFAHVIAGGSGGLDPKRSVQLPTLEARFSTTGDFNRDGFVDIAIANASTAGNSRVPSYVYWGAREGFSPARRTELPTLGATGVAAGDLNQDGFTDLVFSNAGNDTTHDVASYIYWGSATGFAPYLRGEVQTFGAASVNVADLDGNGRPDLLVVNQYSGKAHGKVYTGIFWGNPHHYYSTASMTQLPGLGSYDTTVADFNDDGFTDVELTNSYTDHAYLYWGAKEGFSEERRVDLPAGGAWGSSTADLDRDGYLDLVFTHKLDGKNVGSILWGGSQGYSKERRTVLQLKNRQSLSNNIADLNRDGYLDLIFPDEYFGDVQIYWGAEDGYSERRSWTRSLSSGSIELADLNGDGFLDFVIAGGFEPKTKSHNAKTRIFWGTAEGTPSERDVIELEAYQSIECAIADLNRDGNLDLVMSNYMSDSTRALPLFIYWGAKGGRYSNSHRTELPAESSAGVQTIDLNKDGYPEIIIHNHLRDGDHSIASYIYWNGPDGFDRARRTELPTFGPHMSQMTDPGNIYTRALEEEYVSPPIEIPQGRLAGRLSWTCEEPAGSQLKFQIRSAANREGLAAAIWRGPDENQSYYLSPSASELRGLAAADRFVQYRAIFTSGSGGEWPVLSAVEVGVR